MPLDATLITDAVLTAPEALAAIARATGAPLCGSGTADPRIVLAPGRTARVAVAKFGDESPVVIDVRDERGAEESRSSARELGAVLAGVTGWSVTLQE